MQRSELPHNTQCEKAVLAACMIDEALLVFVVTELRSQDFFEQRHREIFSTILDMHITGQVVDIVTVSDNMSETGAIRAVGGRSYISDLLDEAMPYRDATAEYCRKIKESARHRELIERLLSLLDYACDVGVDSEDVLGKIKQEVWNV